MGRVRFWVLARRAAPCAVVVALLLSGCAVLPVALGAPSFEAATLAAPDAWSFTDVTLRPSVQQALLARDVYDFYASGPGGANFGELPTRSGQTVDFEKDVLPHLDGEIAVAASGTVDQPHLALLVHTDDVNSMLRLLASEAKPAFTRDARGATRYNGGDYVAAGYKNWVVYTDTSTTIDQTLDRIDGKGGPTLATDPRYQSVVDRLTGDRMGFGYVNLTPLLESNALRSDQTLDTASARGRMAYSLAFAAGPQPGLRALDTRFEYIPDTAPVPSTAQKGDSLLAMDRLPVGNAVAVSGPSVGQVVESIQMTAANDVPPDLQTFLGSFAGPYAFGVSPAPGASFDSGTDALGSVFFLGQLAPDADAGTVQDLATQLLDEQASDSDTYQHQVVTDGNWMAVNVVPAAVDIDQLPQDELASDRVYQSVRSGFSQDGSNVYVNLRSLVAWGQQQGASSDELAALGPLQAVGASWRGDGDGAGHGRMQIMISLNT